MPTILVYMSSFIVTFHKCVVTKCSAHHRLQNINIPLSLPLAGLPTVLFCEKCYRLRASHLRRESAGLPLPELADDLREANTSVYSYGVYIMLI